MHTSDILSHLYREESEKELLISIQNTEIYTLPSGQEIEMEKTRAPDLIAIQQRVKDVMTVLGDFKNRRRDGTLVYLDGITMNLSYTR